MDPVAQREAFKNRLIQHAQDDPEIVGAALVGSTASGSDRWSDLDLTFAISPGSSVDRALRSWTGWIAEEFGGVALFDLPIPGTIYRVFLFPGALQVDLSFSEPDSFGSRGPRFELLFGEPVELPFSAIDQSPSDTLGWAVHHLVRANVCIERNLLWQAEYWVHQTRDFALTLACLRRGIEARYGKGFDKLPAEVTARFQAALTGSIDAAELRRSLAVTVDLLLEEAVGFVPEAERITELLPNLRARLR